MTNEQLFFGVSIPLTVFLISVFLSNRALSTKLGALEQTTSARFDTLEQTTSARFDTLEQTTSARFDTLERTTSARFDTLEQTTSAKFDALTQELRSGFGLVNTRIDGINTRIDGLDKKLIVIEGDLRTFHSITGNHEGRLSSLEARQTS